jgi:hypothetical protein
MLRSLLIYIFILFSGAAFSQMSLNELDISKISQKKVKEFIQKQKKLQINHFADLKTTCCDSQEMVQFKIIEKDFIIKDNIIKVWEEYTTVNPSIVWKGKIISFGFLYSRSADSVLYNGDSYPGLRIGQILYLNFRILKGLYNLPLAFEIVRVDKDNKIFEFSYVNGNKARGRQIIKLEPTLEGFTKVAHQTIYKSNSRFRDKALYPFFHNRAISEFHQNVKNILLPGKAG